MCVVYLQYACKCDGLKQFKRHHQFILYINIFLYLTIEPKRVDLLIWQIQVWATVKLYKLHKCVQHSLKFITDACNKNDNSRRYVDVNGG